jgi:hypothetical protein
MLDRIKRMLISTRTIKSIAFAFVCMLSLFVVAASLTACVPVVTQKSAMAQPLDQAVVKVGGLVVSQGTVNKGEIVSISAKVTNNSQADGVYNAVLRINNDPVAAKAVTISAGETQVLNFTVPANNVGAYQATFGGFTAKYTVVDQTAQVIQASSVSNNDSAAVPGTASCCDPSKNGNSQTTTTGASSCCGTPAATGTPNSPVVSQGGGCCGR